MSDKLISQYEEGNPASGDWVLYEQANTAGSYLKTRRSNLGGGGGASTLATPSLTVSVVSSSQINLSWTNVANESSYLLQRSLNGVTWTTIATPVADSTTFNNTGLSASTLYYYRIKAVGDGVTYVDSGYGSGSGTTSASGATQLNTPGSFSATPVSPSQVNLSWADVANESSYSLEWSPNGTSGWTAIGGTIAAGTTSFNHTGLTPSTAYFYRLKAVGNGTTFTDSNFATANATTGSGLIHQSTFTAANGTAITAYTPEVGSAWANQSGTAEIQGNEWTPLTATGGACVSDTTLSTTGDYTYKARYKIPLAGGRAYFQFKTNGSGNGVFCDMFLGVLTCGQIAVAGGYTTITTITPSPSVNDTNYHDIEFVIVGTGVTVKIDGATVGSFSYSGTLTGFTKVGIGCENTSAVFTTFEAQ